VNITVGVKYCGHCDPDYYGPDIINLTRRLNPDLRFVSWEEQQKDVLLIVSSCGSDCAEHPPFTGPVVHVAGRTVERRRCSLQELPSQIGNCIKEKRTTGCPEAFKLNE